MATEVQHNLRNLLEMMVLAMCVHGDVDRLAKKSLEWTTLGMTYISGESRLTKITFWEGVEYRSCGAHEMQS